ncbi:MAG: peptidylprolyl isomerase [Flavobacteriaceae bacterium]|nr:peptidylprolyl isomerase [Flavobacteriaceae bacterium]
MRAFILAISLLCFWSNFGQQQPTNSEILITINSEEITVDEFLDVYNKNINLVQNVNQKDIDDYLELYLNYKLKLLEARALKYDQKQSYKQEYEGYKKQLEQKYLTDKNVTEALIQEAYNRTIEEVKAQHILVRTSSDQDTLAASEKLNVLRNRFLNEDFDLLKKEIHDGKKIFAENLGYFSAFKMVYDFENAAFNTSVGDVSQPFKTQFGYHIVKVLDKRPSRGKAKAAHIMIAHNSKDSLQTPEQRINELHRLLLQGESFENLAKQFSEDKSSAKNGGNLKPFSSSEINSEIFVDTAFGLEDGAISNPIRTKFGWHIIKLISTIPVKDFEEIKFDLEQKVKRDSRSSLIEKKMIESLKKQYQIDAPNRDEISSLFFKVEEQNDWTLQDGVAPKDQFIKIQNRVLTHDDFLIFLNKKRSLKNNSSTSELVLRSYNTFLEEQLMQYKKDRLPLENKEYAQILKEYEEGLMLFDIMQEKIWDGAKNDSIGLLNHYESNQAKFIASAEITGTIARSKKKSALKKIIKMWSDGRSNDDITNDLNAKRQQIILSTGSFEIDNPLLPKKVKFKEGISSIFPIEDSYVVLNISAQSPQKMQSFEDSKGAVISSYQAELEKHWIENLRTKYNISINKNALDALKSKRLN